MNLRVKKNLISALAFIGVIWAVYLINLPLKLGDFDLNQFGLEPRTLHGLLGIFTMPFLHDGLNHLLGNTVPLVVLLLMLAFTHQSPKRIIICLTIMSGVLLWVLGREKTHVGASALVYALAVYLMAAGYYERKVASVVVAVLVIVLYGGLFWGLLPTAGKDVSWEGHLLAAIAGGLFAAQTKGRFGRKQPAVALSGKSPIAPNDSANSPDIG